MAIGLGIIHTAIALGFAVAVAGPDVFAVWVEIPAALLGAPFWVVATVMLTWPPGMTRRDYGLVALDGVVGAFSLLVLWFVLVMPFVRPMHGVDAVAQQVVVWGSYVCLLVVLLAASAGRRSGALPIGQLVLLQSSALVFVVANLLAVALRPAHSAALIGVAVLAFTGAGWLFRSALLGPAVVSEGPSAARLRQFWSRALPFLPAPLAALAVAVHRYVDGPLPESQMLVVLATLVVVIGANVALRLLLDRDLRRAQDARIASPLSGGPQAEWFESVLGDSREVITVVDRDGTVVYQTPSAAALLGRTPGQLVGGNVTQMFPDLSPLQLGELLLRASHSPEDRGPHELVLVDDRGRRHDTETVISPLRTQGMDGYVLTTTDVTDRRQLRAALVDSSTRDAITGLPNRQGFLSQVRAEVPAASAGSIAVALMDLHGFRAFNDFRGHEAGDDVLRVVAGALDRMPPSVTAVGRTGADEFALLVAGDPVGPEVGMVDRSLREALTGMVIGEGRPETMDFALGYAVKQDRTSPASELVEQADLALAAARIGRSPTPVPYRGEMRSALVSRLRSEADLRDALESDRLFVVYQPIVSLADYRLICVEALARLRSPSGEIIGPAGFISVAEDLGLVGRIGLRVMTTALQDSREMSAAAGREIPVAVNVSPTQVAAELHEEVSDALRSAGVPATRLTLEVTENVLVEHRAVGDVLERLRGTGTKVALDDFGTGYSSLSYLAGLPVDALKVDRSFVGDLAASSDSFVLVRAILQLARNLGLTTVAEGVETVEQADILRGMGCDRGQGYLFGRPMPLADLLAAVELDGGVMAPGRTGGADR